MNLEKEFIRTLEMSRRSQQTAHKQRDAALPFMDEPCTEGDRDAGIVKEDHSDSQESAAQRRNGKLFDQPQTSQAPLPSTNSARERNELDMAEPSLDYEPHSFNGLTELEKLRQERDALRQALKRQEDLRAHYGRQIAQLNKIKKKYEENWSNQPVTESNKKPMENAPNGINSEGHHRAVVANEESGEQSFDISATPTVLAELGELVQREETLNDFIEQIELSLPKPTPVNSENAQNTSRCCVLPTHRDFNRSPMISQTKPAVNVPSVPLNEVEPVNGHLFSENNSCDWNVKEFNHSDKLNTRQCMVGKLNQLMGIRQQFVDIRNHCKSAVPFVNGSSGCDLDSPNLRLVNSAGNSRHLQNLTPISHCSLNETEQLNSVQGNNPIFNSRGQSKSHWSRKLSSPRKDTPRLSNTATKPCSNGRFGVIKEAYLPPNFMDLKAVTAGSRITKNSRQSEVPNEMNLEESTAADEEEEDKLSLASSVLRRSDPRMIRELWVRKRGIRQLTRLINFFQAGGVVSEVPENLRTTLDVIIQNCDTNARPTVSDQNTEVNSAHPVRTNRTGQAPVLSLANSNRKEDFGSPENHPKRPNGYAIDQPPGSYRPITPQTIECGALTPVNTISSPFRCNRGQPSMRNSTWLSPNTPDHLESLTDRQESSIANEPNSQLQCSPYENVPPNNNDTMRVDSCLAVDQMTGRRPWSVSPNLSRGRFLSNSNERRTSGLQRYRGPSDILRDGSFIRNTRNRDTSKIPWRSKNTYKPTNLVGMNSLDELAYEAGNKFAGSNVHDVPVNSYALQHAQKRQCCGCCALQNRLYLSLGQICVQLNNLTREMLSTHRQMSQFYPNGLTSRVTSTTLLPPAQQTVTPAPNIYLAPSNHFSPVTQNAAAASTPVQQQLFVWNPLGTTAVGAVLSPPGLITPTRALNLQEANLNQQVASNLQALTSVDKNTDLEVNRIPLSSVRETKNCQSSLPLATGEEDAGIDDAEGNTLAEGRSETISKAALNTNPKVTAGVSDPVHISVECTSIDLTADNPEASKPTTVPTIPGFDTPNVPLLNTDETNRIDLQAVYREVVCLIAQHDKDPEFLVRLFSSLRKLTRYKRQKTNVLDYLAICISQLQLERSKRRLMGTVSSRESSVSPAWAQSNSKLNDPIEAFFSDRDSMRASSQHISRRISRKYSRNGDGDHRDHNVSRQTDMFDSKISLDSGSQYLDPVYTIPTPKVSYAEAELRRKLLEHKNRPSSGSLKFEFQDQMLNPKTVVMRTDSCHSVSCATESSKTNSNQYTTLFDNLNLNGTVVNVDEMRKQLRERNSMRRGPSSGAGDCPSMSAEQNSTKQGVSSDKVDRSVEIPGKVPSVDGSVERSQTGSLCSDASIRQRTESVLSHIIRHLRYMCSRVDPSSPVTKPLKMDADLSKWLCESVQSRFRRLVCAKYGENKQPKNPGDSSTIEAPPAENFHSLTPEFIEVFLKQLGTQIEEVTSQFEGQSLVDCIEDLVIELSDMLTEELTFLAIMTGPKGFDLQSQASTMTSLSSFYNQTGLHSVVACEYADGRGGDSERNTCDKTRNTAGQSGGGELSADGHCSESEESYKDEDWETDDVSEGGDKEKQSKAGTRQNGTNQSDSDHRVHHKLHGMDSSEVSESETKYLFGTNDAFAVKPDLNPDIVESIEDLAEPAEDLSGINAAFENLLDGAIFDISGVPEASDLEDVDPVTVPGNSINEESEKSQGLSLFSGHETVSHQLEKDKNPAQTAVAGIVSEEEKDVTPRVSTKHGKAQPADSDAPSATECKPVPNHAEGE